jgi:hypothetical protein
MLVARFILFGLVAAQLADAMSFTFGVSRFGIGMESNGFAAGLYRIGGLNSILALKGAVIVATIALLVTLGGRFPRLLVWGGATATSFGVIGFLSNATSMLVLDRP